MSNLSAEKARLFDDAIDPILLKLGVLTATKIYRGGAVGLSTASARNLVAADSFIGFADETKDNTGATGALEIAVRQQGIVQIPVTGVTSATAYGTAIYASDGNTFTTASTGNSQIGKFIRWISSTTCLVFFQGVGVRSI